MVNKLHSEIRKRLTSIESLLDKEFTTEFMNTSENEMYIHHFGLGSYIRNNILTPNEGLYDTFVNDGIFHKDDMSALVLAELLKFLIEKQYISNLNEYLYI